MAKLLYAESHKRFLVTRICYNVPVEYLGTEGF